MQQGYAGDGEITILTPYVGQLLRLRQAFQEHGHMKLIISERDEQDMTEALGGMEDLAATGTALGLEGQQDEEEEGGEGRGAEGIADGSSSSTGQQGVAGSGSGTRIVEFKSSLRIATIDNFQVSSSDWRRHCTCTEMK